jgi:chemotaxis protein methyltransferase CheR
MDKTRPTISAGMTLSLQEYQQFQDFLRQSCGIVLSDNKQYLVKNRLVDIFQEFDLKSFQELLQLLRSHTVISRSLNVRVVDAMTTNETFWFRDQSQFDELQQKVLPELIEKKTGTIRIWSAACSSRQQPYSISLCIEDILAGYKALTEKNVQIIGTDISEHILEKAKKAVYSELESSRGLDTKTRALCFQQIHDGFKLKTEISQRVRFQQFNLLKSFSVLGRFDIIFCRNVLIYFSDEIKRDILTRMANVLEVGGYIFLSSTESMPAGMDEFEIVRGGQTQYFRKIS